MIADPTCKTQSSERTLKYPILSPKRRRSTVAHDPYDDSRSRDWNEDEDRRIEDEFGQFEGAPYARGVAMLMLVALKLKMKTEMATDVGWLRLRGGGAVRIVQVLETAHTVAQRVL